MWILIRVVAIVAALQMSGALHAAADVLASFSGVVASDDCVDDEAGKQCPPGCPNCHCPSRSNVAPPEALDTSSLLTLSKSERLLPTIVEDERQEGPERSPLYRPPRFIQCA